MENGVFLFKNGLFKKKKKLGEFYFLFGHFDRVPFHFELA